MRYSVLSNTISVLPNDVNNHLYFMAEAISPEGGFEFHIFAVAWAALTLNLIVTGGSRSHAT